MSDLTCSIDGCESAHHSRGWCSRHCSAWKRHRDPLAGGRRFLSPADALAARTEWRGGCLVWTGSTTNLGYGQISTGGKLESSHRVAWELANGPIPSGMEVDHTCWERACCNVAHLRLASHADNGRNRKGAKSNNPLQVRNVRIVGGAYEVTVNRTFVGRFATLAEAADAAALERKLQFGEFAGRG